MLIISFMAIMDAIAPNVDFRVSAWLIATYVGILVTFYALIEDRDQAAGLSMFLIGGLMCVYNLVWQASFILTGGMWAWPVDLFPFSVAATPALWAFLLIVGAALMLMGGDEIFRHRDRPKKLPA